MADASVQARMHVCRMPSAVDDTVAPLDQGSYCADYALDDAFKQLDSSVQPQDVAVRLHSAILPVDVPVPRLPHLGRAQLSVPIMLARIEQVLDGLQDWSGIAASTVPSVQLIAELCEILQMGSHALPFAAGTLSQHLPAWERWLETHAADIPGRVRGTP